jgi:hypothetical protein
MKFLCVACDEQMQLEERALPGDGTLVAAFRCSGCDSVVAMLTNPMETRLVSSLGVRIGGEEVPEQPLQGVRGGLSTGRGDAFADQPGPSNVSAVQWSVDAVERLNAVPSFVRGMVKRLYVEYARERGILEITPAVMDQARTDLGLEGM